ncbi:phage tail assembly chaperone [Cronobacter dublinensis]
MRSGAPTDKEAWGAYRKVLREVPQQDGFPVKAVWPVPPVVVSGE